MVARNSVLQQTLLDTRFMDSLDNKAMAFQDSYGAGICISSVEGFRLQCPNRTPWFNP
jgi:hypothetical protein